MNILVDMIPTGASNRPGLKIKPTHITIHNTANGGKGADALMHAKYLKGKDAQERQVSWHYTVDEKRIVKHLPTLEKGWHCGKGNHFSVGIEICEYAGIDQKKANENAAELVAHLMDVLDIPIQNVVPHQYWTGKYCPHLLLDQKGGFEEFRKLCLIHS